jgi:polyisoprenoid-binding protein YceI
MILSTQARFARVTSPCRVRQSPAFRWHRLAVSLAMFVGLATNAANRPPIDAPAGTYRLEGTHASLTWRIRHMGLSNYTARFKRFDATLRFDPENFSRSSVEATVDLGSVETDFVPAQGRDFNEELRSAAFFNVVQFPRAVFVSKKVTRTGPRTMRVDGDLTLLGITQPLSMNVTLGGAMRSHPFAKVPALGFSATAQVPRMSFGMNPPAIQQGVGTQAEIVIEAEFLQTP